MPHSAHPPPPCVVSAWKSSQAGQPPPNQPASRSAAILPSPRPGLSAPAGPFSTAPIAHPRSPATASPRAPLVVARSCGPPSGAERLPPRDRSRSGSPARHRDVWPSRDRPSTPHPRLAYLAREGVPAPHWALGPQPAPPARNRGIYPPTRVAHPPAIHRMAGAALRGYGSLCPAPRGRLANPRSTKSLRSRRPASAPLALQSSVTLLGQWGPRPENAWPRRAGTKHSFCPLPRACAGQPHGAARSRAAPPQPPGLTKSRHLSHAPHRPLAAPATLPPLSRPTHRGNPDPGALGSKNPLPKAPRGECRA